jgi:hypothetical protein
MAGARGREDKAGDPHDLHPDKVADFAVQHRNDHRRRTKHEQK